MCLSCYQQYVRGYDMRKNFVINFLVHETDMCRLKDDCYEFKALLNNINSHILLVVTKHRAYFRI